MTEGTRLAPDWHPQPFQPDSAAWRVAGAYGPFWLQAELEKFRAYWAAQTGRKALKLDWGATWAVWVLRAHGFEHRRRRRGK